MSAIARFLSSVPRENSHWLLACFVLVASLLSAAGCSLCTPGYIDDYATVGGKWNRSDPSHGRVGSIFSDQGYVAGSASPAEDYGYHASASPLPESMHGEVVASPNGEYLESATEEFSNSYYDADTGFDDGVIILGDEW